MKIKLLSFKINNPKNLNLIFGQAHFIKTVEDIHETLVSSVPGIKFGLAFSEASGDCLVRTSGNDETLIKLASENLLKISSGHTFLIFLENAFPINILPQIKNLSEVCNIYCATSNPVEVILAETKQGRGVLGVIDGFRPKGIEGKKEKEDRFNLIRNFGYKLTAK